MRDIEVGERCSQHRSNLEINYPMKNGKVMSWEDMRHVWDYTFGEEKMNLDPKESLIMLTEPPMNPNKNREKMLEEMFENYGFHGAYIATQAVLTLYAQGLLTGDESNQTPVSVDPQGIVAGVVVDSGDGVTHIVAVYDGFTIPSITKRLDIAGRDITQYLIELLLVHGYVFNKTADFDTVR